MSRLLQNQGYATQMFLYRAHREGFSAIVQRLQRQIEQIGQSDDYVLIGHSLGGVLIRQALAQLNPHHKRPHHIFLLGSPTKAVHLAQRLRKNWLFRTLAGDSGQLLQSSERMNRIAPIQGDKVTSIVGIKNLPLWSRVFTQQANDGIVTVNEVSAPWLTDVVPIPVAHVFLHNHAQTAQIILNRLSNRI